MDILVVCPDGYDRWAFGRVEGHCFHFVDAGIRHWEASPEFDPLAYLDRCREVMRTHNVDAVVSTHDLGDLIAAVLADEAGLPGPSPESVFLCLHKLYGRRAERDPIRCEPLLLDEPLPALTYPAYLKPPWLKLGLLGFKLTSDDDARAAMDLARRELPAWTRQYYPLFATAIDLAKYPLATTDMMLVEEFVEGRQVTVEGWSLGGDIQIWAITDTNTFAGSRVIDNFSTPSRVDAEMAAALTAKTIDTMRAFDFDGGFFNIEFWLTTDGVRLTEVNGRSAACFGGIYELAMGAGIFAAVADVACGRPPRALPRPGARVAGQFNVITFDDDLAGNLLNYEAAMAMPEFSAFRSADERVRPMSEFGVVLGQIEISGNSYDEMHARAESMRRRLLKTK
ncbi:MAG: ATP-grasp domain-containing protein [Acidobacteriota bacterium]|nr:ATP-grasp domain-containing protein [Acidobacteriota bacterium]